MRLDHTFVAVGLGGLCRAGIELNLGFIHGVAACDDRTTFRARVLHIAQDMRDLNVPGYLPGTSWDVLEGYHASIWARNSRYMELTFWVAEHEGFSSSCLHRQSYACFNLRGRTGAIEGWVLFWHTGELSVCLVGGKINGVS